MALLSRSHISVCNVFCFHQVSYSPMASDLSNKDKFPLLYITVPPYSAEDAARLAFLRYFRWKRIATIRQNEYVFNEVLNGFCPVKCLTFPSSSSQKSHLSRVGPRRLEWSINNLMHFCKSFVTDENLLSLQETACILAGYAYVPRKSFKRWLWSDSCRDIQWWSKV